MKLKIKDKFCLSAEDTDRLIGMAWEDRTPFEAIEAQFGLKEKDVVVLMREEMTLSSWKMWRKRMSGRSTKHAARAGAQLSRHKCSRQRHISDNKISKRRRF
jgi:uncharacterized protein (TIGR03643 family)